MRRFALALAAAGIITTLGFAGLPAQAHEWGWGYHRGYQQEWRGHQWREHRGGYGSRVEHHWWPHVTSFRG